MTQLFRRKIDNFFLAFLVQKAAEYLILSTMLFLLIYIGSKFFHAAEYLDAPDSSGPIYWLGDLIASFSLTFVFYVPALYIVFTLIFVSLYRKFIPAWGLKFIPAVSAAVSLGYVKFWLFLFNTDFNVAYWIVSAIMTIFIYVTSVLLYPPRRSPVPPAI